MIDLNIYYKTPSVKYGSGVSCVLNQLAYLCSHLGFSLHLHKKVCTARNFKQAVNFPGNKLMQTSIIVLAERMETQYWELA